LVHDTDSRNGAVPSIRRIMVTLDGSIRSEGALPYAKALATVFDSELILMTVPAVPEMKNYRAAADVVETIRAKAEVNMRKFLEAVARSLRQEGFNARAVVTGSMPARTIVSVSEEENVDLIMLTSRGRGGLELLFMGSVAERVVQSTELPVFMVPILAEEGLAEAV
jgi:nucleotide-binding universal stress UspA family protein